MQSSAVLRLPGIVVVRPTAQRSEMRRAIAVVRRTAQIAMLAVAASVMSPAPSSAAPVVGTWLIRDLVLDDQRSRNELCWFVFDC